MRLITRAAPEVPEVQALVRPWVEVVVPQRGHLMGMDLRADPPIPPPAAAAAELAVPVQTEELEEGHMAQLAQRLVLLEDQGRGQRQSQLMVMQEQSAHFQFLMVCLLLVVEVGTAEMEAAEVAEAAAEELVVI